jgi:hypothetical protein
VRKVVGILLFVCVARTTQAASRRLALITNDPELTRSVSIALTPWGVDTVPLNQNSLGAALPDAAEHAADLARHSHFDTVVWISTAEQVSVLWVYDATSDEVSTRVFSGMPPLPSSVAASVALSLKTLLRATVVAPEAERFGAAPRTDTKRDHLQLQSGIDVRFFAARSTDWRIAMSGLWWLRPPPRGIGVNFEISASPGVTVATEGFSGQFRDIGVAPSLLWYITLSERLSVAFRVGGGGHATVLNGTVVPTGSAVAPERFNVTFDAGALLDFIPSRGVHLAVGATGSYLAVSRRYLVNGVSVLELWRTSGGLGTRIGFDLF